MSSLIKTLSHAANNVICRTDLANEFTGHKHWEINPEITTQIQTFKIWIITF